MNTLIIPGYGDERGYIDRAVRNWSQKYGIQPDVRVFGWFGAADDYEPNWERFDECLKQLGEVAIIGISAGASVGVRALQAYPDKIKKLITVCSLVDTSRMDLNKLHNRYPVLERSLQHISLKGLPAERIMTLRPLYDEVIPICDMKIEGAKDVRLPMIGHSPSLGLAMYGYARTMANFIHAEAA